MSSRPIRRYRPVIRIEQPIPFVVSVVSSFVKANDLSDHEDAKKLIGFLRNGSFGSAVRLADSFTLQSYGDARMHYVWNQLAAFVRKCPIPDITLTPEQDAWKKFLASEHLCKRTNQRIIAERNSHRRRYSFIRDSARRWISRVIGRKPDLREIYRGCGFGPGASVGVHGQATHLAAKLGAETWTSTPTCSVYARHAMMGEPLIWEFLQERRLFCIDGELFTQLFENRVKHVTTNLVTMVPKTAMVHRTIAIEPTLNGYVQKGVDLYLRRKLRRVGLDLTDQGSNSFLAKEGSETLFDPFSTIDLSSASDSVSIEVCRDLLPPDWFSFLDNIRSPAYESKWGSGRYHKFVSMGNGFCFPLETLIFASLAYAVNEVTFGFGDSRFRVYGDDIIVRQHSALLLIEILKFLGFRTNNKKTFLFGPFRESCGADFFEGVNVRPYELDFIPATDRDLLKIANGLRSNLFLFNPDVWNTVHMRIDKSWKFLRPCDGPPDSALTVGLDFYLKSSQKVWNPNVQTWSWLSFRDSPIGDPRKVSSAIAMYGVLFGLPSQGGHPVYALRRKTKTRVVRIPPL